MQEIGLNKKKIIITADDLGLSEGINRGIITAYRRGLISCVSLMANGMAFDSAVRMIKGSGLDIGAHLTFLEEKPVSDPAKISNIVGDDGYFFKDMARLIYKIFRCRSALKEIETEAKAQIEKILHAGIKPSFFNSHQHVHMLPNLFRRLAVIAGQYNIKAVRLSNEDIVVRNIFSGTRGSSKKAGALFLKFFGALNKRWMKKSGFKYPVYCAGILKSGHLDECAVLDILKFIPNGVTEIIFHPGYSDESTFAYSHWHYHWQKELSALTSAAVKKFVFDHKIEITNFNRLS